MLLGVNMEMSLEPGPGNQVTESGERASQGIALLLFRTDYRGGRETAVLTGKKTLP